jgi:ABC-type multidrug transport system permease subunit
MLGFTLFNIISYFLCDFPADSGYFTYFYFALFFSAMNAYYFAMFLAASTGNEIMALTLFPICFLFLSTFAGYAIPVNDVPPGMLTSVLSSFLPFIHCLFFSFLSLFCSS